MKTIDIYDISPRKHSYWTYKPTWLMIAIDVLFPLVGWLIEGFEKSPLTTGLFDDRWYTKPAPLFLPKGHYWLK
jgi:hypothetical protein